MNTLQKVCLVVTIIGAINWGFVGLLEVNLVESLFGVGTVVFLTVVVLGTLSKYI